jgi:hypothetical protein
VSGLLFLAPALLLLVALFAGRFPGERRLAALVARARPRTRRRARVRPASASRAPWVPLARGGALLAHSLAKRPPPLIAHC